MELRHLRYFVAVAEERHFSRAAERLHVSQPPLSRQIQDLERELQVELFRRKCRVELTEAGRVLLEQARRTIEAADGFARTAGLVASGVVSTLRIGYPATAIVEMVPAGIQQFRERFPDVTVDLVVDGSAQHLRSLRAGLIDAGVVRVPPGGQTVLPCLRLEREHHVLLMNAAHPLSGRQAVSREQLQHVELVVPARRCEPEIHEHLLADLFDGDEPTPSIALEVTTLESLYGAVRAGLGVALLPESSSRMLQTGDVVVRPLTGRAPVTDVLLVWSDTTVGRPLEAFLDVIAGNVAEPAPAGLAVHSDPSVS